MDILDLSVGEKRSRRKAHVPQRRQALSTEVNNGSVSKYDTNDSGEFDDENNNGRSIESVSTARVSKDYYQQDAECYSSAQGGYEKPNLSLGEPGVHDNTNQNLSPYSSHDSNNVRNLEDSRSPSPAVLLNNSEKEQQEEHPGMVYSANANDNNNIVLKRGLERALPEKGSNSPAETAKRFASFSGLQERLGAMASDVQPTDTPGIPERTKKQNRWAFNVWREWARKRNLTSEGIPGAVGRVPLDVGKATEAELDYWLSKFVQEIRRKDGNPYPSHTLMQIVMGIQRYLRQQAGRPSICILDRSNPTYSRFRTVLDGRIKELTSEAGTSHKSGRRSSLSSNCSSLPSSVSNYPEQSVLWNAGIIGNDTALRLLNAVFYHNTVTFGIRVIDDHWNLKMSHFVIGNRGQQSQMYVEFVPSRDPVYVNRGLTKDCRVYAELGNPRCVVKLFQKYISLVPPDGAFYRHPQEPTLVDRSIRFSDQWVGKNRLRAMIKHVFDSTRLDGRDRHHNVSSSTSHRYLPNKFHANSGQPDANTLNAHVYDRLAQVMLQLSHMRSSPHQMQGSSSSVSSPANTSPSQAGHDTLIAPKEEETPRLVELKSGILPSESNSLKPNKQNDEPPMKRLHLDDGTEMDDVKVTSSCEKHVDENMLELAVPEAITAVTITRGSRRITIQLE
ncbi:unnamed protein product [Clavelina lepadiformis]|uniref:Uncharacterized protein n=1 Tax=Clavelina lepadiformis TaxID=159417 RepID=A0ABP0G3H5_CLALP